MAKEKNAILFWQNWVANQLTFGLFLINVFILFYYKTVYFSANLQPNYARIKSCYPYGDFYMSALFVGDCPSIKINICFVNLDGKKIKTKRSM